MVRFISISCENLQNSVFVFFGGGWASLMGRYKKIYGEGNLQIIT